MSLRVGDGALVLHRWPAIRARDRVAHQAVENTAWISPARAERIVAERLGLLPFSEPAIVVRDLRDGDTPAGTILTWRRALDRATLGAVAHYVEENPETEVRLYGTAVQQLPGIAEWRLRRLRVAGAVPANVRMESVRELHLEAAPDVASAARSFPNVRALRIASRAPRFDARSIAHLDLRALDCCDVAEITGLRFLPGLRALRIARTAVAPDLDGLNLETLALDHTHLESLEVLAHMPALVQAELRGFWQLRIADARVLLAMPNLLRTAIDIGGRRKNIEIYRDARWAYPWPFESAWSLCGDGVSGASSLNGSLERTERSRPSNVSPG